MGEILRPYLLARQEGIKATSAFATVIVERLLDMATVLLLFACALPLGRRGCGPEVRSGGRDRGPVGAVRRSALLFLFAGHPERLGRLAGRLGRRLPRKLLRGVAQTRPDVRRGSGGHAQPRRIWPPPPSGPSPSGCRSPSGSGWSHAFDLTSPFVGSFIVVGYLAVGVSVPTPGGAGGFHYFYLAALTSFFGANPDVAAAAAIVLHLVSFVPVTIAGLVFMWQDGLTLGRLQGACAPRPRRRRRRGE